MPTKRDVGVTIAWTLLVLVVIALLTAGVMAINGTLLPFWYSIQRHTVENSKSFTDSNNLMLQKYITEYSALDVKIAEAGDNADVKAAYQSQQQAIVNLMCEETSTMQADTIKPSTRTWLNSHGGCR